MSGWNSKGFGPALLQDSVPCGTFDGTDDYVSGTVTDPGYPRTLACRMYIDSAGAGADTVISLFDASATDQSLAVDYNHATPELRLRRTATTGDFTSIGTPSEDAWHTLVARFNDATTADVWLDGVKTAYTGLASKVPTGLDALAVGVLRTTTPANYLLGRIADVQLAGNCSDAECESFSLTTGLAASWPISEGLGPTAHDAAGSSDGTVTATESEFWANTRINR